MSSVRLRVGTSSFSAKGWVGPFYPVGTKPAEFLAHYATQFDTVEVDATYYAIPSERTVRGWAEKVPEGFSFSAKFPASIVHCGEGPTPDPARVLVPDCVAGATEAFLHTMGLLGERCGPLVLQFPWFGRRVLLDASVFLDRLAVYLESLPTDFRYAVEIRNRDWIGEPLLDLLREQRVAFVWAETANMPHPAELARRFDTSTTDFVYARLIGDRQAVNRLTTTFDETVLDKESSLLRWAELIQRAPESVSEVRAYANNHFAGHGPATARRLRELVGAE